MNKSMTTRRTLLISTFVLPISACGPSPTITGGFKNASIQSFRDRLTVQINTTILFDRDISVFSGRLLDYLGQSGLPGINANADVDFLLNTPLVLIGSTLATPFERAEVVTIDRKPSEVVVTYRARSPKITAADLPRDQPGLPQIVNAKYRSNYRWSGALSAKLIYSLASKNKLFSELTFEFSVEQKHAFGWDRTEGDWIDREGLRRLGTVTLESLNSEWFKRVEDRFSLPRGSVNIRFENTNNSWNSENCKSCSF